MNVPSFKASCIGQHISDVTITLAAVDPCYSCTERLAVVERRNNKVICDYDMLLKMSRQKTDRISKEMGIAKLTMEDLSVE